MSYFIHRKSIKSSLGRNYLKKLSKVSQKLRAYKYLPKS